MSQEDDGSSSEEEVVEHFTQKKNSKRGSVVKTSDRKQTPKSVRSPHPGAPGVDWKAATAELKARNEKNSGEHIDETTQAPVTRPATPNLRRGPHTNLSISVTAPGGTEDSTTSISTMDVEESPRPGSTPSREKGASSFTEAPTLRTSVPASPRSRNISFHSTEVILTTKQGLPAEGKKVKPILAKQLARDLPDDFDECFSKVTGISQATMAEYRARLREGEELLQFRKHGESRSRMVRVTEDGSDIKYVDVAVAEAKRKSIIGKALSSVMRKQRSLAEVHCIVYGRVPPHIRRDHQPWLCFSIRFYTEQWDMMKTVHFGCTNDEQTICWFLGLQLLIPMSKWHQTKVQLAWQRLKLKLKHYAQGRNLPIKECIHNLVMDAKEKLLKEALDKARESRQKAKVEQVERKREQKKHATRPKKRASKGKAIKFDMSEQPSSEEDGTQKQLSRAKNVEHRNTVSASSN